MKAQPRSCLVDTNIMIALFAGDPNITGLLRNFTAIHVPIPVLGELYHGAAKSSRINENVERLEKYVSVLGKLDCDHQTARQYGKVKHELEQKGRPIPENDIWIAALALQHDLAVVTRDRHFKEVIGLHLQLIV